MNTIQVKQYIAYEREDGKIYVDKSSFVAGNVTRERLDVCTQVVESVPVTLKKPDKLTNQISQLSTKRQHQPSKNTSNKKPRHSNNDEANVFVDSAVDDVEKKAQIVEAEKKSQIEKRDNAEKERIRTAIDAVKEYAMQGEHPSCVNTNKKIHGNFDKAPKGMLFESLEHVDDPRITPINTSNMGETQFWQTIPMCIRSKQSKKIVAYVLGKLGSSENSMLPFEKIYFIGFNMTFPHDKMVPVIDFCKKNIFDVYDLENTEILCP